MPKAKKSLKSKPKEKKSGGFLWIGTAVVGLIVLTGACERVYERYNIKMDNPVEEVGEAVLEHYTGVDIDFTPSSPEQ